MIFCCFLSVTFEPLQHLLNFRVFFYINYALIRTWLTDDYSRTLTGSPCWKSNQPASMATWPREVAKTSFRTKEVRSQYLKRQRVVVTTKREQEVRRLPTICCGCRYRLITGRSVCCLCQLFLLRLRWCEVLRWACLYICMSVCLCLSVRSYISKMTSKLHEIFCTCYLWP